MFFRVRSTLVLLVYLFPLGIFGLHFSAFYISLDNNQLKIHNKVIIIYALQRNQNETNYRNTSLVLKEKG